MSHFLSKIIPWLSRLNHYYSFNSLVATPTNEWRYIWIYGGMILSFFIIGLVLNFIPIRTSIKNRLNPFLWINFLLGLLLFFLRQQEIPLFGIDLWRVLQEIAIIGWLMIISLQIKRDYPKEKLYEKIETYRKRFLPKKK